MTLITVGMDKKKSDELKDTIEFLASTKATASELCKGRQSTRVGNLFY